MTEEDCWRVVELARAATAGDDVGAQAALIARHLATRPLSDIIAFNRWMRAKMLEANRAEILTAVEWVFAAHDADEVSGDSWEYVRGWLVGRGKRGFYAVLDDADVLAELFTTFDDFLGGEAIEYAAHDAYELQTGDRQAPDEMYERPLVETWPGDDPDARCDRDDLTARYPKLTKRFGPRRFP